MKILTGTLPQVKTHQFVNFSPKIIEAIKIACWVILATGLVFGSVYLYQKTYADKIYPSVKVASYNLGGKNFYQAKLYLTEQASPLLKKPYIFVFNDQEQESTLANLGSSFNIDKSVNSALNTDKSANFFHNFALSVKSLFKKENINLAIDFDRQKLKNSLGVFSSALPAAVDASLKYENEQFALVPSKTGKSIDLNKLENDLNNAFLKNTAQINLVAETTNPEIADNEVDQAKIKAEKLAGASITLTFENQIYQIGKNEIAPWIKFENKNGQLDAQVDSSKITAYLEQIAKKIDIKVQDKEILEGPNTVLKEGKDGRELNRQVAASAIANAIVSKVNKSVALQVDEKKAGEKIIKNETDAVSGLFPGKYIDIDLSAQVLTIFERQNALGSYRISTGKWSMPTPVGIRYVDGKNPRAYSSKYNLYMPFWNSIGGGYGIHELPEWANGAKEGESHLGTPVSHGCVRLGVGPAETVYNWADIGTPVNIHK